jgi:DnaJ-class molecular chaperone
MKPYKCPICNGTGTVPAHFYVEYRGTSLAGEITCRSCNGIGILWGEE